jgi:DNA-binding response OmpR family regulator
MKTILVVDDELQITQLARAYLEQAGLKVFVANDGKLALASFKTEKPDLVVLDLGLPGMDGLDVTRAIRKDSRVPIIMLTARGEESDKLVGLELGADDYIVKPFSPKELVARVRAVLRRSENAPTDSVELIRTGALTLDLPRMKATMGDRLIKNIRRKLEPDPRQPQYILTVYGVGYKFTDEE